MSQFIPEVHKHYDDACASLYFPANQPANGKAKVVIKNPQFRLRFSPASENHNNDLIIVFVSGYNESGIREEMPLFPRRAATPEDVAKFFVKSTDEAGNITYTPRFSVADVYFRVTYIDKDANVKANPRDYNYTYVGFDASQTDESTGELVTYNWLRPTGEKLAYEPKDAEA